MALVETVFTAAETHADFPGAFAVVIDVLRATTSMVTLFERGALKVHTAAGVGEARLLKRRLAGALLCGERGGFPPEGFDYGNSPAEFAALDFEGATVVLTTTNGTAAVAAALAATSGEVFAACLRNADAVAQMIDRSGRRDNSVVLFCAGTEGHFTIEDYYAAGSIARRLEGYGWELSDASVAAALLAREEPSAIIREDTCLHLRNLITKGFNSDIEYSLETDVSQLVPLFDRSLDCFIVERDVSRPG